MVLNWRGFDVRGKRKRKKFCYTIRIAILESRFYLKRKDVNWIELVHRSFRCDKLWRCFALLLELLRSVVVEALRALAVSPVQRFRGGSSWRCYRCHQMFMPLPQNSFRFSSFILYLFCHILLSYLPLSFHHISTHFHIYFKKLLSAIFIQKNKFLILIKNNNKETMSVPIKYWVNCHEKHIYSNKNRHWKTLFEKKKLIYKSIRNKEIVEKKKKKINNSLENC